MKEKNYLSEALLVIILIISVFILVMLFNHDRNDNGVTNADSVAAASCMQQCLLLVNNPSCEIVQNCKSQCGLGKLPQSLEHMCGSGNAGGGGDCTLDPITSCPSSLPTLICTGGTTLTQINIVPCVTSTWCDQLGGVAYGESFSGPVACGLSFCPNSDEAACYVPSTIGSNWICASDSASCGGGGQQCQTKCRPEIDGCGDPDCTGPACFHLVCPSTGTCPLNTCKV